MRFVPMLYYYYYILLLGSQKINHHSHDNSLDSNILLAALAPSCAQTYLLEPLFAQLVLFPNIIGWDTHQKLK